MIGRSLHHFEITAKLGEGGMGEVYRATDSKLGREVAIKVLPPAFTDDPERLARFEREAKVLAAFNHPNVAGIYEVGEADGTHYLAMELAEGNTLSERLEHGVLPLDEALPIARQIAAALEAAHDMGIVHRDLKPANVMLDRKGGVKVLDFGLAKAWEAGPSQTNLSLSPTLTAQMTQAGVIMGTAGYMSPEQARGHEADRRSDIWSFGVVLHEMVTGQRMFQANTVSDTLARVLMAEPDWQAIGDTLPPPIARLLRRSIERDPKRRLQAIGEARIAIDDYLANPAAAVPQATGEPEAAAPRVSALRTALWGTLGLAAGLAIAFAIGWWGARDTATETLAYSVEPPHGSLIVTEDVNGLDISRDGRKIAFVATSPDNPEQRIYIKQFDEAEPWVVAGTEGARSPFFSPDGEWIAYFTDRELRKISLLGGSSLVLASTADRRGGVWGADGWIYFAPHSSGPISKISQNGGEMQPVSTLDAERQERTHRWPALLPDGSGVLYTSDTHATTEYYDDARIELVDLASGERKVVLEGSSRAVVTPSGRLLFARDGSLYAVPFDLAKREVTGSPQLALQEVSTVVASGAVQFAISRNGSLVYMPGGKTTEIFDLVWLSTTGESEIASSEQGRFMQAQISPDDTRVALASTSQESQDLWVLDLARETASRLTFEASNSDPVWTPDGRRILFASNRDRTHAKVFVKRADGTGRAELVWDAPREAFPMDISPDGRLVLANLAPPEDATEQGTDIWIFDLTGESEPVAFLEDDHENAYAAFSPDGRWVAYVSDESDAPQVYVRPFPSADGKWQISRVAAREPRWSPDGRSLYFRSIEGLQVVDVDLAGGFSASRPRVVEPGTMGPPFNRTYSVSSDSRRILALRPHLDQQEWRLHVVTNWMTELERKLGAGG